MSTDADDTEIIPGDLVILLSSFDAKPMTNIPPGLVLEVKHGKPSTGAPHEDETYVCSVLWQGFVDKWVSIEWLQIVSRQT